MAQDIVFLIASHLVIPKRLRQLVQSYLMSLMIDADRHSMKLAEELSGSHRSQFSRLLSNHGPLAEQSLIKLSRKFARQAAKNRKPLVKGTQWSIAIIIDSMLHPRSSLHVHNAQRFNHGKGFVIGHQWTNAVIVIGDEVIPLVPIEFLTRSECARRGVEYKTTNRQVQDFIASLELFKWAGIHDPSEVVVLMDSGFDDKAIERTILDRGWDFIVSLKTSRSCRTTSGEIFSRVDDLFWATRKQAPWKTVRIQSDGGKRRTSYRARKLLGHLKGIQKEVALVCSEKANKKGRRYLACSKENLNQGTILRAYRFRWLVELFHRAVKGSFGATDVAAHDFQSVKSHVHWSYCAYLLFRKNFGPGANLQEQQRKFGRELRAAPLVKAINEIVLAPTQFGGIRRVKIIAAAAIQALTAA